MKRSTFFCFVLLTLSCLSAGQSLDTSREAVERGISLAVDGQYEAALAIFRSELKQKPEDSLLHYYAGMAEFRLLRFGLAVAFFEASVARKAPFPQVYYWLSRAYLEEDERENALSTAEQGESLFPKNRDLLELVQELRSP